MPVHPFRPPQPSAPLAAHLSGARASRARIAARALVLAASMALTQMPLAPAHAAMSGDSAGGAAAPATLAQKAPFTGPGAPGAAPGAPATQPPRHTQPAKPAQPAAPAAAPANGDAHTILPQPPAGKAAIGMSARFGNGLAQIPRGLVWRVFDDRPEASGAYPLVAEAAEPAPVFFLSPGGYVVHVSYGLASVARRIVVGEESRREQLTIPAGGVVLHSDVADKQLPAAKVSYDIFEGSFLQGRAASRPFYRGASPGDLVVLPAGEYYVVSTYGDGNAVLQADIAVQPGKVSEATLHHRAAEITLRLVPQGGGAPLPAANWSVLTPGGDSVKDSAVPTPLFVLAEGEYTAVVRADGKSYSKNFTVETGKNVTIDITVGEQAAPSGEGGGSGD